MTRYLFKVCLQIFLVVSMSFSFSYFLGESFDDNLVSAINFGDYVDGVSSGGGIDELMDSLGGGVGKRDGQRRANGAGEAPGWRRAQRVGVGVRMRPRLCWAGGWGCRPRVRRA